MVRRSFDQSCAFWRCVLPRRNRRGTQGCHRTIHSLTDHRRILPIDKTGELIEAHPEFLLVISYNPGYQSVLKDLKPSTRQRFVSLEFDYPAVTAEATIIAHESGVDADAAERLAVIGEQCAI